jgi:hypothetical protein
MVEYKIRYMTEVNRIAPERSGAEQHFEVRGGYEVTPPFMVGDGFLNNLAAGLNDSTTIEHVATADEGTFFKFRSDSSDNRTGIDNTKYVMDREAFFRANLRLELGHLGTRDIASMANLRYPGAAQVHIDGQEQDLGS